MCFLLHKFNVYTLVQFFFKKLLFWQYTDNAETE